MSCGRRMQEWPEPMVFFSVIMPVFNRASLIGAALDSVLQQTFTDYEVIVVDDGSTDSTMEVLRRYGDRLQVIPQPNQGAGAARNTGIRQAQGQYLTFLDSDDVWFPWTLATYYGVIQSNQNPAFVAGQGCFFRTQADLTQAQSPLYITRYPDYLATSRADIWIGTCAVAIRTEVIRQAGGFSENRINGEDSDLWLKLGTAAGFVAIHAPLVFGYRQHLQSAIANHGRTCEGMHYLIQQEKTGQYPGHHARQRERWILLTRHVRPVSLACLRQGQWWEGWRLYCTTLWWHVRLGRIRYLIGFWLMLSLATLQGRKPYEIPCHSSGSR